ncbi:MAG: hypothetical protein ACI8QZ_002132 [Chlamydiales bacterium]|jgi:hypothetical protein
MKNTLSIAIAAGAVAGFLAGSLSSLVFSPTLARGPAAGLEPVAATPAGGSAPSPEVYAALRSRLDELTMRLALVEAGADHRREPAGNLPDLALANGGEDETLAELASALGTPGKELPDSLKLGVEQVVQDVRNAERQEREAERAEAQSERTETRLSELVTALDLTGVQTNEMRDYMTDYAEKRAELMETARASGDFYNVRDSMRTLRDESRTSLALILDPRQLELYQETEDDGRGRGERRGGGSGRE